MKTHRLLALACTLPALASCALFRSSQPGPGRVQEFVAAIERVHVEGELARERAQAAVRALQVVAGGQFGSEAVSAYEQLMTAIGSSEGQADVLATSVATMHASAQPVFEHWAQDVEAIADPALRQRSSQRLLAARERYRAIADAIDPALAQHRQLNQRLRDHALFLGHDLNPAALADVRPGVEKAQQDGRVLQTGFDAALAAARAYLEVAALPVGTPTQPTAAPAAETAPEAPRPAPKAVRLDGQRTGNR